ncbi:YebC/PmpR family DNA-binding transcriptional regulator, partial [Eubacterium aggregans]|uniref:YebC/PmpR family DNA-binding transcriptional regulator n=1 Tax=Eubacterium aggregans TaxID=81409 RepID=UPI003F3F6ADB
DGYTIITAPEDFAAVMDAMGENDIEVLTGEVAMIPSTETALSPEDVKKMEKILDMFDDNDDVQEVWHNWNEGDE